MDTVDSVGTSGNTISIPRMLIPALRLFQARVTTMLEQSGIIRGRLSDHESERLISNSFTNSSDRIANVISGNDGNGNDSGTRENDNGNGDVAIRIMDEEGVENVDVGASRSTGSSDIEEGGGESVSGNVGGGSDNSSGGGSSYQEQRYDLQQFSVWIEQIVPIVLLLLVVFIRQHLQGFFVTSYVTAILYKSNDILREQTALKGERKSIVLLGYSAVFILQVIGVYWWYQNDDLYYSLFLVPPKAIPPFVHASFIIIVNDTMVRQAAMVLKLALLLFYRNGRSHNFRRQGQMLTLIEYMLLLYRTLLPAPIWYKFFLNKDYGGLFSSLTTGLYLTVKLSSVVEKVGSFYAALQASSRKEVQYGSYATSEQVTEAGDLCAICQEKMQTPIELRCEHIFCEDCVSEWFERERTCPLCRAVVRPAELPSFGDGSTSLFCQFC